MNDLQPMLDAFAVAGEDPAALLTPDSAHLVAYGHDLASLQSISGVTVLATGSPHGIEARIDVDAGVRVPQPVHLCFGLLDPRGVQKVQLDLTLGAGAAVTVWSHCLFTRVEGARHLMQAAIILDEDATLDFQESHYHGDSGGIEVRARAAVKLAARARYRADFSLLHGRVGRLDLDTTVDAGAAAIAELASRVYGTGNDSIRIRERVDLNGASSHAIVRSRVALRDEATAEIVGATHGNAAHARGHVDCTEIVRDRAVARAVPEVSVTHPLAKVTHEAAIGAVDTRQLETLMARGVAPDEAMDILVRGMLTFTPAGRAVIGDQR